MEERPVSQPGPGDRRTTTSPVDVAEALLGAPFPASKEQLVEYARRNEASEEALDTLEALPEGNYDSPADVMGWVRG